MDLQYNRYVFALAFNTIVVCALFFYTWKLKKASGARYFAFALFACMIWNFASLFELSSTLLSTKIFFAKISYLGVAGVANFWFFFAIASSQKNKIKNVYKILWIIPFITFSLALTNEWHHLIWTDIQLSDSPYGIIALYKHGSLFFLNIAYSYILLSVGALFLIKKALDFPKRYRTQSFILIIAVCIPRFGDALNYIGLGPMKGLEPGIFFFTFSAALIVFGYLKLNLLNITPIAQEIIFSNMAEGIIVTDVNDFLLDANQSAIKIFNHDIKLDKNIQPAIKKYFPDLLLNQFDVGQEILAASIGNNVWYEVKINHVKQFDGDLLGKIFIFRDITERKLTEGVLKESEKHLIELNEIKNRFFSILSHDLRSPFSGLIGFIDILKEDFASLPEAEKESFINEIDLTTKNTYGFLEDLLEWSRLNMNSFKAQIEKLKLFNEVEEVFNLLFYSARKKDVRLINELNQQDSALGDSSMVKLLLRNLISNAIKFSNKDDAIRIYSTLTTSHIEISIADSGTGIPQKDLMKLFRLDTKHTKPGTADERGSGIGLVLCKEIVDKLNGDIKVESKIGKGSIFTFSLPLE